MQLRLLIAAAVVAVGISACNSAEDDVADSRPSTTTSSAAATSSTTIEDPSIAWGQTTSGVEDLPVPDIATRGPEGACQQFAATECETWSMPSEVTVMAVRRWYLERVAPTSPWRETWQPCFDGRFDSSGVQADGQDTLGLSWSRNGSELLALTASNAVDEPVAITILRRSDTEMPCQ